MMKRLLPLLVMLVLLAFPAAAEDVTLFRLELTEDDGTVTTLGSAVLLDELTFMSALHVLPEDVSGTLYAVSDTGSYEITAAFVPNAASDILLLETGEPVDAQTIWADQSLPLGAQVIRGHNVRGEAVTLPITEGMQLVGYNGLEGVVLTCGEPLLPGATLYNETGEFQGLVVADWGERVNACVALTVDAINQEFSSMGEDMGDDVMPDDVADGDIWYDDFSITYVDGLATLDWSGCAQYDPDATHVVYAVYQDNPYYFYDLITDKTVSVFSVMPGQWYFWVKQVRSEDPLADDDYTMHMPSILDVPNERFTDYDYQNIACSLGSAPSAPNADVLLKWLKPLEQITKDMLYDPDLTLYFQMHDAYTVTESISVNSLLTLEGPDHVVVISESTYTFLPEYGDADIFACSIDSLIADYLALNYTGTLESGEYVISSYLAGRLTHRLTFTLE